MLTRLTSALLLLALACGGRATNNGDQVDGGTSGDGGTGGTSGGDGTGGLDGTGGDGAGGLDGSGGESVSPEVAFCREYLIEGTEGGSWPEEEAKKRCDVCAEAIAECAPHRRCIGGYCYQDDEGQLICTCSEGA